MNPEFQSVGEFWDHVPARVLFIFPDYRVSWANAPARQEYEKKGIPYVGRACYEVTHQSSSPCDDCPLRQALFSRKGASVRHHHRNSDGRSLFCEIESIPVLSDLGEVHFFINIEEDMIEKTERTEHPVTLLDSPPMAQLEAIFSGFQDSLFILNPQYEILLANKAFLNRWGAGRSFEEIKGHKCHHLIHGLEDSCPQCTVTQTILTGRAVSGERYLEEYDQVFFEQTYPIFNEKGEMTSIIRYSRNITEEKRLQEQLIQAEKLAGIGLLASGVAHEINNPLTGILGFAEILQKTDDPTLKEQYLEEIIACSKKVAHIVKDLSSYSPLPKGEAIAPVNLNQALKDALGLICRSGLFGDIEAIEDLGEMESIRASKSEIQQIFVNLITNAVEAMEGKGLLRLTTRKTRRGLEAAIQDSGPGIAKGNRRKIFNPFFTTKPPGQGIGLGLNVTHRLVTKYRGKIEMESREGESTTFRVIFPTPRKEDES